MVKRSFVDSVQPGIGVNFKVNFSMEGIFISNSCPLANINL